jgi:DnaJ-class molecular chaperone
MNSSHFPTILIVFFGFFFIVVIYKIVNGLSSKGKSAGASTDDSGLKQRESSGRVISGSHMEMTEICPSCNGSGHKSHMETKMVPTTKFRTDSHGHQSMHTVMEPQTQWVNRMCLFCHGTGRKKG